MDAVYSTDEDVSPVNSSNGKNAFDEYILRTLEVLNAMLNPFSDCDDGYENIKFIKEKSGVGKKNKTLNIRNSDIRFDFESFFLSELLKISRPIFNRHSVGRITFKTKNKEIKNIIESSISSNSHSFNFALPHQISTFDSQSEHRNELLFFASTSELYEFYDGRGQKVETILGQNVNTLRKVCFLDVAERFGLREERKIHSSIRLQSLHGVCATEPRIGLLGYHWAILKSAASVRDEHGSLDILGFTLNNNEDWVVDSHGHPSEVYEYLARVCNVTCKFCYLHGNPTNIAISKGIKVAPISELRERLRLYDPAMKKALFKSQWEINEFLVDPNCDTILKELRLKSSSPFFFVTNGNPLTEKKVKLLSEVAPVHVIVSLNTTDLGLRREIMGETIIQTTRANDSLDLLNKYRIPFGISIAAFPDLKKTDFWELVKEANRVDAVFIRINLPGVTDCLPKEEEFDIEARWKEVVYWVKEVRPLSRIPIITIPSAYEKNLIDEWPQAADIWGTVKNSPAERAGLKPGDVVVAIGGIPVKSRSELISLGLLMRTPLKLRILRGTCEFEVNLPLAEYEYPYLSEVFGKYLFPLGLVAAPSLGRLDAKQLEQIVKHYEARNVLFVTSPLMLSKGRSIIKEYAPDIIDKITWVSGKNYTLGGNIKILDMASVEDIVRSIKNSCRNLKKNYDLVVVPSSGFNSQGRDIVGRHWSDLEMEVGVKVEPIDCHQFLF